MINNLRISKLLDKVKSNSLTSASDKEIEKLFEAQDGGEKYNYVPKSRVGYRPNADGTDSTHLMAREYVPGRGWVVFPTLYQNSENEWVDMGEIHGVNWWPIYEYAEKVGEIYDFGEDEGEAVKFADEGSWKNMLNKRPFFKTRLDPSDELNFQKFYKTLPKNLQTDDDLYDIRGYWDAEGKPNEFDYSQEKQEDGEYHAYSRHPYTGKILKSPAHPTFQDAMKNETHKRVDIYGNIYTGLPKMQDAGTVIDKDGYIDIEKSYGIDPLSAEGIQLARDLASEHPNAKFVCTSEGCAQIASDAAEASGYDFSRSNAWDVGNRNTVDYVNPVYQDEIGQGQPLSDPDWKRKFPQEVFVPGNLVGLNRRNNKSSYYYADEEKFPGSRGYEHIGYMLDDKTLLHGTGKTDEHPAYFILDDISDNRIKLPNYGSYEPVESISPAGALKSIGNFAGDVADFLGFKEGGELPKAQEGTFKKFVPTEWQKKAIENIDDDYWRSVYQNTDNLIFYSPNKDEIDAGKFSSMMGEFGLDNIDSTRLPKIAERLKSGKWAYDTITGTEYKLPPLFYNEEPSEAPVQQEVADSQMIVPVKGSVQRWRQLPTGTWTWDSVPSENVNYNLNTAGYREGGELPKAQFGASMIRGDLLYDDHMNKENDTTLENFIEIIDPTGILSHDDAKRAYEEWQKSGEDLPTFLQSLDMFGAVPALGKLGKLKYIVSPGIGMMKKAYDYLPWQQALNILDGIQDLTEDKDEKRDGGNISQMGYRDDSQYRDRAYIDIETKDGTIDMSETGKRLLAIDLETGEERVLHPYSGLHKFVGKKIREIPLKNRPLKRAQDGKQQRMFTPLHNVDKETWDMSNAQGEDTYKWYTDRNMFPVQDQQGNWSIYANQDIGKEIMGHGTRASKIAQELGTTEDVVSDYFNPVYNYSKATYDNRIKRTFNEYLNQGVEPKDLIQQVMKDHPTWGTESGLTDLYGQLTTDAQMQLEEQRALAEANKFLSINDRYIPKPEVAETIHPFGGNDNYLAELEQARTYNKSKPDNLNFTELEGVYKALSEEERKEVDRIFNESYWDPERGVGDYAYENDYGQSKDVRPGNPSGFGERLSQIWNEGFGTTSDTYGSTDWEKEKIAEYEKNKVKRFDSKEEATRQYLKEKAEREYYEANPVRPNGAWNNYGDGPLGHVAIAPWLLGGKGIYQLGEGVFSQLASKSLPFLSSVPGATYGNLASSYVVADALQNRIIPTMGEWGRGEWDPANQFANIGLAAVDLYASGIGDDLWKGYNKLMTYKPLMEARKINTANLPTIGGMPNPASVPLQGLKNLGLRTPDKLANFLELEKMFQIGKAGFIGNEVVDAIQDGGLDAENIGRITMATPAVLWPYGRKLYDKGYNAFSRGKSNYYNSLLSGVKGMRGPGNYMPVGTGNIQTGPGGVGGLSNMIARPTEGVSFESRLGSPMSNLIQDARFAASGQTGLPRLSRLQVPGGRRKIDNDFQSIFLKSQGDIKAVTNEMRALGYDNSQIDDAAREAFVGLGNPYGKMEPFFMGNMKNAPFKMDEFSPLAQRGQSDMLNEYNNIKKRYDTFKSTGFDPSSDMMQDLEKRMLEARFKMRYKQKTQPQFDFSEWEPLKSRMIDKEMDPLNLGLRRNEYGGELPKAQIGGISFNTMDPDTRLIKQKVKRNGDLATVIGKKDPNGRWHRYKVITRDGKIIKVGQVHGGGGFEDMEYQPYLPDQFNIRPQPTPAPQINKQEKNNNFELKPKINEKRML